MRSYLLILRRDQSAPLPLPEAEMFARFKGWTESLHHQGVLRAVERLKPSAEGTSLLSRNGQVVSDGPYQEAKEAVIGFYQLETPDHAAALALARDCPILLAGGSVEIREIEPFPRP